MKVSSSETICEELTAEEQIARRQIPDSALHPLPPSAWANSRRKRFFDVVLALCGLLLLWPVMLVAAFAIVCDSEGGVFFRQERAGLHHAPFVILKFRTMCDGAEFCGPSVTGRDDERITRVGRVLRRLKLDELPQLYNVLRGDMSFVGPRPKLKQHECMHMLCRPGITGAASLLFTREEELLAGVPAELIESYTVDLLNPVKARLDLRYAHHSTFGTDLQLIFSTIFKLGLSGGLLDIADLVDGDLEVFGVQPR